MTPDEIPEVAEINEDDWEDLIWREPPEGWDQAAITPDERHDANPGDFWSEREAFGQVLQYARSRMAGPWAVLGAVLARVVAATPPYVQIPPIIGTAASLNLFIGFVGASGSGKGAASGLAAEVIDIGDETFKTAPLGSGEGLSHMFMRQGKRGDPAEMYNRAAMVEIPEIDNLAALANRQASTLNGQLRQAAMGEQLGFFYVDEAKRMMVPEHRYRMCLWAGIQPRRSMALLNDADGGTPQRFVWLPVGDKDAPDVDDLPPTPEPMTWRPPDWNRAETVTLKNMVRIFMPIPEVAVRMVRQARQDQNRGVGDALDSHALLTRIKVACALAILDGRIGVSEDDWRLAGVVMAVSDGTRAVCVEALAAVQRDTNVKMAVAEAERAIVVSEKISEADVARVSKWIRKRLARAGGDGVGRSALRGALRSADRQFFDLAIDALSLSGDILTKSAEYRGQTMVTYLSALVEERPSKA